MSKFYDELMNGLTEAVQIQKGELKGRKVIYDISPVKNYNNLQIKQIRTSSGMTQKVFAEYIGVSKKTVEAWENGTNHPSGSAKRLISLLEDGKSGILPFLRKKELKA